MSVLLGAALVIGVITACAGPFYYCKRLSKQHDISEPIDSEPPLVHIKISHPHRKQFKSEIISDASDTEQNPVVPKEDEEANEVVREAEPNSSEEAQIVPVKSSHKQRRASTRIWSSAMKNQLENITNSSSEVSGYKQVVKARIEVNPVSSESSGSLRRDSDNVLRRVSTQSNSTDDKTRKLSYGVVKKWKHFKKTLICSRSDQSTLSKDTTLPDEIQRLTVPVQTLNQPSSMEGSAILHKNRLVDVSTSTRISANGSNTKTRNDEVVTKYSNSTDNSDETLKQSLLNSNTEALQEVVSLIKRQSVNGKSICDVRISGLAMNQAQLLDLFGGTEGGAQSASIITTEEASIISIKFHRRRNSSEVSQRKDTSFYECPLSKFYRSLPEMFEDLSISRLFRSHVVSEGSDHATHTAQTSEHSRTLNNSRNQTSYLSFPKVTNRFVAEGSMINRERSLSGLFNNSHVTRIVEERRL